MVGNNLKDSQLQQIVDKTILFHDKDGDGKISFQEFCDVSFLIPSFSHFCIWIEVKVKWASLTRGDQLKNPNPKYSSGRWAHRSAQEDGAGEHLIPDTKTYTALTCFFVQKTWLSSPFNFSSEFSRFSDMSP